MALQLELDENTRSGLRLAKRLLRRQAAARMEGTHCARCPAGRFASSAGARACAVCGPGNVTDGLRAVGSTACTACSAGRADADNSSSTACVLCSAGRYARKDGQLACAACKAGQYAPLLGAKLCTRTKPCRRGVQRDRCGACGGNNSCVDCAGG